MYTRFMTKSYGVATARAKLATIVDEVSSGTEVAITRRGKTVAVVLSAARYARLRGDRVAFSSAYDAFLAEHDLTSAGEGTWSEGTRDRSRGRDVEL